MKQLSRREINELWMRSSDIYDFAHRIQRAASNDESVPEMREHMLDVIADTEHQILFGLQSGDPLVP